MVSESMAVSESGVSESMVSESMVSAQVVGISISLRLSLGLPLAVHSVSESMVSESTVSESGVSDSMVSEYVSAQVVGISLSLGEGNSGQAGNKDGFDHLGLFLHLVLGGESPCTLRSLIPPC